MSKISILCHTVPGYAAEKTIKVNVNSNGVPLDKFWRDRLKDAAHDNCCEIVTAKKQTKKTDGE